MPASPAPIPAALLLVRHGESVANVARQAALASARAEIDLALRDPDVPLSPRGERQAIALGRWFAERPAGERPTVVVASPYVRARRTAELFVEAGGMAAPGVALHLDERWREKELGIFHDLTRHGVEERHPEQWALRQRQGAFWYRPPNGESGADVAFRVRAALDAVAREHAGERVLVVAHQIAILCARYVLERLTEERLMAAWRAYDLANCSVTSYAPDAATGRLALVRYNATAPMVEEGATVTTEPAHG